MFATTQTQSTGSPRHRCTKHLSVGSKRTALSSPVARAGFATSCAAATPGAAPTISTPVHFTKVFKMGCAGGSTVAKVAHARSKSLDGMTTCGVLSSDSINVGKCCGGDEKNNATLDSPLRSRRALPSLSVGAANDNTLKGRQGIVYIDGTKMPQDGWYQRCFGCGMWTAQSVVLGQFEVYRCRCCAREFRSRAKSLSNLSSDVAPRGDARSHHASSVATSAATTTCWSDEVSQSSILTSDTATTDSTRGRRSPVGVTSNSGEGVRAGRRGGGGGGNVVAVARRAVRRSARSSARRRRYGEGATSAAELPPLHPSSTFLTAAATVAAPKNHHKKENGATTAITANVDTQMFDAAEVADSDAQQHHQQLARAAVVAAASPDAQVLTSLVSKLRDFLVVNMPHNGVENSLRRCESSTLPPPTLRYT